MKKEATTTTDKNAYGSKTAKAQEAEYHFSGGGEYEPCTIKATSREEAEKKWEKERKAVEQNTEPEEE